eukprot:1391329-Pyramimonas_sp.AAC.1
MGSVVSSSVGSVHEAPENWTGSLVHEMLLERSLWAPSTFPPSSGPSGATWYSPQHREGKKGRRIDCGLLTLSCRAGRSSGPRHRAGHHHRRS